MPVYLLLSYILFTVVPVGLTLSIYIRRKRIQRELNNLDQ